MRYKVDFKIDGTHGDHHAIGPYEDEETSVEVDADNRKEAVKKAEDSLESKWRSLGRVTGVKPLR